MKYLLILIIFILNSCTQTKSVKVEDLNKILKTNHSKKNTLVKSKKILSKNNKTIDKSDEIVKKKEVKKVNKKKILRKERNTKMKKTNKVNKLVKKEKNKNRINIFDIKNIDEYEYLLKLYSKNSDYPNINN